MKNGSGSLEQAGRGHKLPRGLYALVDDSSTPSSEVARNAAAAIEGGAAVVQLRFKRTDGATAISVIREVLIAARGHVPIIVNDRVDWAVICGADGVHVGAADLPVSVARRLVGDRFVGATTRTLADIERAVAEGADHVGLGPIFATTTKALDVAPLGLEAFGAIARDSVLPVVGIAGITLATIGSVARAGAHAAAVSSGLFATDDVVSRARALHQAFWAT